MKKLKPNAFDQREELSRAQMRNVMGGYVEDAPEGPDPDVAACQNKTEGSSCSYTGKSGTHYTGICVKGTWISLYCNTGA